MCFTFKKSNKQTKKPVNCFLQDDASAGIESLQTSIEIKLLKPMERTIGIDQYLESFEYLNNSKTCSRLACSFHDLYRVSQFK